jgi:acetylglutamate kinase
VVLVLFLLFAVPSLAVFFGRPKVIVDPLRGSILDVFDLRIYRTTKTYPIDQVKDVTIVNKTFRTSGHSSTSYAVQILLTSEKLITVAYEDKIEDAREIAAQIAGNFSSFGVAVKEPHEPAEDEEEDDASR